MAGEMDVGAGPVAETPNDSARSPTGRADPGLASIVRREPDAEQPDPNRALVKSWVSKVKAAKEHPKIKAAFGEMREDEEFAGGKQWDPLVVAMKKAASELGEPYVANLIHRHIHQRTATLYAKNPKAYARRRASMDFEIWDGSTASLERALMAAQQTAQTGMVVDPNAVALLQDVAAGMQRRKLMSGIARTLEIAWSYEVERQIPTFKDSLKHAVRCAQTTGTAWVKLGFQRLKGRRPEDADNLVDMRAQLAHLETLVADQQDEKFTETSKEIEELKEALASLEAEPEIVLSEGLRFDYPGPTSIIPDPKCKRLRGFVSANWVAEEFVLTVDDIKDLYKVDISGSYTAYDEIGAPIQGEARPSSGAGDGNVERFAMVWQIHDKKTRRVYTVADGWPMFLEDPRPPEVKLRRFWPYFLVAFNEAWNSKRLFPVSDVRLLRSMQLEFNRSREGLREHRHANRPKYATRKGALTEEDKQKIADHPINALLELDGLEANQKVGDVLQPVDMTGVDPNLYETAHLFDDFQRVGGSQEANLGGTSGATATEANIAEGSRSTGAASDVDDLDTSLTELAGACGEVMLAEMSLETIKTIVGPGAIWPELTAQEIADQIYLEVQAGSSGKPNRNQEISNFERLSQILMRMPNLNADWFLREAITRLDDRLDPSDAIAEGAPSIEALNAAMTKQIAGPAVGPDGQAAADGAGGEGGPDDPAAQGAEGAMNAPAAPDPNVGGPIPGAGNEMVPA